MHGHPAFVAVASLVIVLLGLVVLQQRLRARGHSKGDKHEPGCDNKGSGHRDSAEAQSHDGDTQQEDDDVQQEDIDTQLEDADVQLEDVGALQHLDSTDVDSVETKTLTDSIATQSGSGPATYRERSYSDVTDLMAHAHPRCGVCCHGNCCQMLAELSSSCPTLSAPVTGLAMKHLHEEGHPHSLENLRDSQDLTSRPQLEADELDGYDEVDGAPSPCAPLVHSEDKYVDPDIRFQARLKTVDSTEDFLQEPRDSSPESGDSDDSNDKTRSCERDELSLQQPDIGPPTSTSQENKVYSSPTPDMEDLRACRPRLISRSYSLTNLLEEEESEETPILFSKDQLLTGYSPWSPEQLASNGRDNETFGASLDDSTDSGSEALSPGTTQDPDQSYMYHMVNGLPISIGNPSYRTSPDSAFSDDGTVHHLNASASPISPISSPTDVASEHTPQKVKRRNVRLHTSLTGADMKLPKSAGKDGVKRKISFLDLLRKQQRQYKAENHQLGSSQRSDQLGSSQRKDQLGSSQRSNQLGSSQRSDEPEDRSQSPAPGGTQWASETMREHRSTETTLAREISQTSQVTAGPYSEGTVSGMTTSISEPFETIDGVIPWLFEEPDLLLTAEELGDHIYTADPANLKKLTRKDIKRQSAIRELINTERHYVNRLKIIQKIFAHTMITKLKYTEDQVNKFFPGIDELVEIHNKFLYQLLSRQATREDRFVDQIGDILLDQFQGASADRMTSVYGVFCCNHNDAMHLYKEFLKNDRNFQIFAKYCHSLPFCEKREIPDFILGVTVRLCKYWILIDGILKYTEDKKERRLLEQASQASKTVLHNVNHKVESYEKLLNIQSKLELKTVTFRDKKFKRQDLTANNRQLVYVGNIGWKSARGRVAQIVAVVLTDIIVFLQQNEQKYTFFMQDNKSCVIPLHDLLVREKGDVRGSLGIYMIIQNPASPELYELVCKSKKEREEWITILQHAITACRKDVKSKTSQAGSREVILSKPVNISRELELASKVKSLVEQLHQKDEIIKGYCEEKNKLMLELLQLSNPNSETRSANEIGFVSEAGSVSEATHLSELHHLHLIKSVGESVKIIFAAMEEATRLTSILQNTESHMNRSISAGEDSSKTHVTIPRRAETFSGFDNSYSSSKAHRRTHTVTDISNMIEETPAQTDSTSEEKDRRYSDTPNNISESEYDSHSWEMQVNSGIPSEHSSMEELSAADMASRVPTPPTFDQMASVSQLAEYLDSLMTIASKQFTMVGSLQAELAGAKKEISRLLADVHSRHSLLHRHDQLEELRQLQGNLTLEKQQWGERKLFFSSSLQAERENIETERRQIEREKMNLRNDQKVLKRERDLMRSELIRMSEQGFQASETFDDSFDEDGLENADSSRSTFEQRPMVHNRSASEDTYDTVTVGGPDMYSPYAWVTADEFPYQPLESVASPEDYFSSSARQDSFPFYSMGTNYEEGISGLGHQSLHVNTDVIPSQNQQSAMASSSPPNVLHHLSSRDSSAGLSRAESLSSASRTAFRLKKNSRSGPSYPPWIKRGK